MSKAEPLIRLGAKPAGTAAELATRDIVFITVGSSDDLISAVLVRTASCPARGRARSAH